MSTNSLKKHAEIFSHVDYKKQLTDALWRVRRRTSVRMRWLLMGLTSLLIVLPVLSMPTPIVLQYTSDNTGPSINDTTTTQWWDRNNNRNNNNLVPPVPTEIPITPLPTLPTPANPAPIANPGNLQQANGAIIQLQQQLQTQMLTCVNQKQQLYNQLAAQQRQVDQLELQLAAIDEKFYDTTDEAAIARLQDQQTRMQTTIERATDTMYRTQERLDEYIYRCENTIYDLQVDIDEKENELAISFSELLQYDLPQ